MISTTLTVVTAVLTFGWLWLKRLALRQLEEESLSRQRETEALSSPRVRIVAVPARSTNLKTRRRANACD